MNDINLNITTIFKSLLKEREENRGFLLVPLIVDPDSIPKLRSLVVNRNTSFGLMERIRVEGVESFPITVSL